MYAYDNVKMATLYLLNDFYSFIYYYINYILFFYLLLYHLYYVSNVKKDFEIIMWKWPHCVKMCKKIITIIILREFHKIANLFNKIIIIRMCTRGFQQNQSEQWTKNNKLEAK